MGLTGLAGLSGLSSLASPAGLAGLAGLTSHGGSVCHMYISYPGYDLASLHCALQ